MVKFDTDYNLLCNYLLAKGEWVYNERTGKQCLTIPTWVLYYQPWDAYPMITTRKVFPIMAMAEIIGYWKGYTSAARFRELGAKTWDANANKTKAWLDNPHRIGEDDMGKVYGYIGHNFGGVDQFKKVYEDLRNNVDDRGEIITYWKPDQFGEGCLRPCMHTYQFILIGDTLSLQVSQRSTDVPLGLVSNAQQAVFSLNLMAKITGHKVGTVTHVLNEVHVYEDQVDVLEEQMQREPIDCFPTLTIPDKISTWGDIEAIESIEDLRSFRIDGYNSREKMVFPFSE